MYHAGRFRGGQTNEITIFKMRDINSCLRAKNLKNNVFPNTRILPKIKKNMLTSPKMVSNEKLHIGNNKKSTQKTIL